MRQSLLYLVVGLTGCSSLPGQKPAMVHVAGEYQAAKVRLADSIRRSGSLYGGRPLLVDSQKAGEAFIRSLQAIDARSCPKDFRVAWADFVAESDYANYQLAHLGADWEGLLKFVVGVELLGVHPMAGAAALTQVGDTPKQRRREEVKQRLDSAWFAFEKVCAHHGLTVQR